MDKRHGRAKWGPGQPRSRTAASTWLQPLRWNGGRPISAFARSCSRLATVFNNEVPKEWRFDLFELIGKRRSSCGCC